MEKSIIGNLSCRIFIAKARFFFVVFIGVIFISLTTGYAQTPGFSKGDMVRISSPDLGNRAVSGMVTDLSSGSVQIQYHGRTLDVPYTSIQKIEVASGRRSHPIEGSLIGAGSGALLGAVIGAGSYSPCTSTEFMGCFMHPNSQSEAASVGAVLGGAVGGLLGFLVGISSRTTRWRTIAVPVDASIGLVPASINGHGYHPLLNVRFSLNRR